MGAVLTAVPPAWEQQQQTLLAMGDSDGEGAGGKCGSSAPTSVMTDFHFELDLAI